MVGKLRVPSSAQRSSHGVGIRATHLPGGNKRARFDEFVARGDDGDARLPAHFERCSAGPGSDGNVHGTEPLSGCQHAGARQTVAAARVDVLTGLGAAGGGFTHHQLVACARQFFDRNNAVGTCRHHRAGHGLDGVSVGGKRWHGVAGSGHTRNAKATLALAKRGSTDSHAIHHHAVKGRLIPFGENGRHKQTPSSGRCWDVLASLGKAQRRQHCGQGRFRCRRRGGPHRLTWRGRPPQLWPYRPSPAR